MKKITIIVALFFLLYIFATPILYCNYEKQQSHAIRTNCGIFARQL